MKLLLVEDNLDLQRAITRYLTHVGIEVFACACAEDMAEVLAQQDTDVIVLDVMLPGQDGFSACEELRKTFMGPIVFISAHKEVANRIKGLNAGADYYLSKPLDMAELEAVIRNISARQMGRLGVPVPSDWQLDVQNWILICPNGVETALSATEKNLLEVMMCTQGEPVSREDLFAALGRADTGPMDRAVDVMISKIRRKVKEQGAELPVRSVRNVGYIFNETGHIVGNKK